MWWFNSSCSIDVPYDDLRLLKDLLLHQAFESSVSTSAVKAAGHLVEEFSKLSGVEKNVLADCQLVLSQQNQSLILNTGMIRQASHKTLLL